VGSNAVGVRKSRGRGSDQIRRSLALKAWISQTRNGHMCSLTDLTVEGIGAGKKNNNWSGMRLVGTVELCFLAVGAAERGSRELIVGRKGVAADG
jgi:hypothetical protein